MGQRDLFVGEPGGPRSRQVFGVHESADRLDRNGVEHLASEDLEGAIDVPNREIEEHAHESVPGSSDCASNPGVSARCAISGDDLEVFGEFEQMANLGQIELEIGVTEEHQLASCLT